MVLGGCKLWPGMVLATARGNPHFKGSTPRNSLELQEHVAVLQPAQPFHLELNALPIQAAEHSKPRGSDAHNLQQDAATGSGQRLEPDNGRGLDGGGVGVRLSDGPDQREGGREGVQDLHARNAQ